MTKPTAMFWSGETLSERLKVLIDPFVPERVDCAARAVFVPLHAPAATAPPTGPHAHVFDGPIRHDAVSCGRLAQ